MTEHVDELLSASLDGELSANEVALVEAHLEQCDSCRAELDAIAAVRSAVRAAPAVDPQFGWYERLTQKRRRRPWPATVASVAAVAAAWIAVLGFAVEPARAQVVPPVDEIRVALTSTDFSGTADPIAPPVAGLHRVDPTATPLPASVVRLPRSQAFTTQDGKGIVVVFGARPTQVVAFIQRGEVDWSTLRGGLRSPVSGVPGEPWESTDPDVVHAFVYQGGDTTVMVVADLPVDQLEQVAREIGNPSTPSPTVVDRLRGAMASVTDAFSLR